MIATVFKDVAEGVITFWVLKVVKDTPAQRHKHQVSEAVQIRCCAHDDTARTQNPREAFQHDVTRYREVLDNLNEEGEIVLDRRWCTGFAEVPKNRFDTVLSHVRHVWSGKVCYRSAVTPKFHAHQGQLASAYVQDVNWRRGSQCSKSLHAFFET